MTYEETLEKITGFKSFKTVQRSVVDCIVNANGAGRDMICNFPTGYGKSICYCIPALHVGRSALVISPLCSLIQDQTVKSNTIVPGVALDMSATTKEDAKDVLDLATLILASTDFSFFFSFSLVCVILVILEFYIQVLVNLHSNTSPCAPLSSCHVCVYQFMKNVMLRFEHRRQEFLHRMLQAAKHSTVKINGADNELTLTALGYTVGQKGLISVLRGAVGVAVAVVAAAAAAAAAASVVVG